METKRFFGYGHSLEVSSGQANQMRALMAHLSKKGNEVYYLGLQRKGTATSIDSIIYPDGYEEKMYGVREIGVDDSPWSHQACASYNDIYKPDEWVVISDIWNIPLAAREKRMKWNGFRYTQFVTHDTANHISIWDQCLQEPEIPLNFSKFSKKMCDQMGYKSEYIPHTVNTEVFKPVSNMKKDDLRAKFGIPPDLPLFLSVGHNQVRKNFDRLLLAFKMLLSKVPQALLWLHASPDGSGGGGWNLPQIAKDQGIDKNILFSDKAGKMNEDSLVSPKQLAELYQVCDAFVLPSAGGGFEIPLVEAMACGAPIITTGFCTGPEFVNGEAMDNHYAYKGNTSFEVGKHGIVVPYKDTIWHAQGGTWCIVDIEELAKAMLYVLKDPDRMRSAGFRGSQFAQSEYSWETILPQWDALFASTTNHKPYNASIASRANKFDPVAIHPVQVKLV